MKREFDPIDVKLTDLMERIEKTYNKKLGSSTDEVHKLPLFVLLLPYCGRIVVVARAAHLTNNCFAAHEYTEFIPRVFSTSSWTITLPISLIMWATRTVRWVCYWKITTLVNSNRIARCVKQQQINNEHLSCSHSPCAGLCMCLR